MTKEFTCIVCPVGCRIKATIDNDGKIISLEGNSCPRGKNFGISELTNPVRTLTSTVELQSKEHPRLPVKTSVAIPKSKLNEAMEKINSLSVKPPVSCGEILIKDFITEGCNLVACKSEE